MQYFGGKSRISKQVAKYINTHTHVDQYVEPFCGACNVATKVNIKKKVLNDKHPYLIAMWKALQNGWIPPTKIEADEYYYMKSNRSEFPMELCGFVGFACAFGGVWNAGYARDKKGDGDFNNPYARIGYNSVLKKIEKIRDAEFLNTDFYSLNFYNSLIYCDPPYKNTSPYNKKLLGEFPYDKFIDWVKIQSKKNIVLVSEYKHNLPEGAKIVLEIPSRTSIRDKTGNVIETVEILFTFNDL